MPLLIALLMTGSSSALPREREGGKREGGREGGRKGGREGERLYMFVPVSLLLNKFSELLVCT